MKKPYRPIAQKSILNRIQLNKNKQENDNCEIELQYFITKKYEKELMM